ncbi:DUF4174 domain-containing protein [Rhizobium halophytocola]|uniref:DUF4174 domain-containing protein n=1 Tax=Rhizobium halophytocola TaxID=735519 RepID=A0ABS4DTJ9_9HYPH|nr:DUF4174 domain-containing protein [Rhizobium halophytocola]MBP1849016.1 hypothetical protein [Rhizobium halophytocola]
MDSLSRYTWKNRVLVLFARSDDPKLVQQIAELETRKAALADRDMVVLAVGDGRLRSLHGDGAGIDWQALKAEAMVGGDAFEAVLVGKDGGIKLRSFEVVADDALFDLVDSMPMRRAGKR